MYKLMKKDIPFVWTSEQETAFRRLKECLTEAPILGMPTSDGMFIVDTDASNVGVGAVLSQQQENSEVVLAYASRTMNKACLLYTSDAADE